MLAEFGYNNPTVEQLAKFGKQYLDPDLFYTQQEAGKEASKDIGWDYKAKEMYLFIKNNAINQNTH